MQPVWAPDVFAAWHLTLPQPVAFATQPAPLPLPPLVLSSLSAQDGSDQAELKVDLRGVITVLAYDYTCILPGDSTQRCFQYS